MALLATRIREGTERLREDPEKLRLATAVAGTLLLGPTIMGAYKATEDANRLQSAREAATAAGSQIAQKPYMTSSSIGATGEFQISKGISSWLPFALIFLVIMYMLFKD